MSKSSSRHFTNAVPDPTSRVADALYVERMLSAVDPAQRAVVVLHFYLDLTLAETAAALGIPVGTAKSRLNRALAAMRIRVADEDELPARRRPWSDSHEPFEHDPSCLLRRSAHAALGDVGGPARRDYLADIVEQAGRVRQRPAWTFLERWLAIDIAGRRQGVPRAAVVVAPVLLLAALLAVSVASIGSHRSQPERQTGLPTMSGAWERVVIETPTVTGRVASVAVRPQGLLAVVGGDEPARLAVSTDGRTWTLVPADQHPGLAMTAASECRPCWARTVGP